MKSKLLCGLIVLAVICLASSSLARAAVAPTADEMSQARQWMASHFEESAAEEAAAPFFSFTYHDKSSAKMLPTWKVTRATRKLDDQRTQYTLTYTDPQTRLVVRCVGVEYRDYPTVEWTLYFKNTGKKDTPILKNIQALDWRFDRKDDGEFVLHHNVGSPCQPNDYQPLETVLGPKATKRISAAGGRPTNSDLSYFNLAWPGQGVIVVVGWPGQWAAEFIRDDAKGIRVVAGQELTNFKLLPGEEVRTPLIVLQFHDGNVVRAQNIWRRWMVAHNIPRPGGKLIPTHYGACWSDPLYPNAKDELAVLSGYIREKIPLEFYFIDAGWYPGKRDWWQDAGTWEVDKGRFPKGIREVSDLAHANGMQFVLWFEPERAGSATWLSENHPEWILGGKSGGLVNLGNRDAWNWIVDRIDSLIKSEGVDVYRQDFNFDPLGSWRKNDAPDRQGITEIKHVTGYLAYWDELLRRHPNLWIDTCASGGRRNDLETLRRSVPLLRSDCFSPASTQQAQTYGIAAWMPYFGSGAVQPNVYMFRSCIFPASRVGWDTRKTDLDYGLLKRMVAEFERVEPYLLGDFYPLTPYSLDEKNWMAWQFDAPEKGEGAVQAFRREKCDADSVRLKLGGLEPDAVYVLTNFDSPEAIEMTGKALADEGLPVVIKEKPGAAIFTYKKKP
jgi:alpha-galactosidase